MEMEKKVNLVELASSHGADLQVTKYRRVDEACGRSPAPSTEEVKKLVADLQVAMGPQGKLLKAGAMKRCLQRYNYDFDKCAQSVFDVFTQAMRVDAAVACGLISKRYGNLADFPVVQSCLENCRPKGTVLSDGGMLSDSNTEFYSKFVELSGGPDKCVIGLLDICSCSVRLKNASGFNSGQTWWDRSNKPFMAVGVPHERLLKVPLFVDNCEEMHDSQEVVDVVRRCTGFWIYGGTSGAPSTTFTSVTRRAETTASTCHRSHEGAPITGTSAGAFLMSSGAMITGFGENSAALREGPQVDPIGRSPTFTYDPHGVLGLMFGPKGTWGHCLGGRTRLGVWARHAAHPLGLRDSGRRAQRVAILHGRQREYQRHVRLQH